MTCTCPVDYYPDVVLTGLADHNHMIDMYGSSAGEGGVDRR